MANNDPKPFLVFEKFYNELHTAIKFTGDNIDAVNLFSDGKFLIGETEDELTFGGAILSVGDFLVKRNFGKGFSIVSENVFLDCYERVSV